MWYLLLRKHYEIAFAPLFLGILTIGICLDLSRNSCDVHWKIQSIIFCFSVRQKLNTWYLLIDLDLLSMLLHLFPGNVSSKLCKTAPSEIILSHYIPAAGGMNALWPKLSTSSERIFIKYILTDIKNGSK